MANTTTLLRNTLLILCALGVSITTAAAEVINSTYTGPGGSNWGDPANWSPPIIPDNNGTLMRAVATRISQPITLTSAPRSHSFTVLTADMITGQFSNVASGGSINVYSAFDSLGNPIGDPVGTFRAKYNRNSLVLDNFQLSSAPTAARCNPAALDQNPEEI